MQKILQERIDKVGSGGRGAVLKIEIWDTRYPWTANDTNNIRRSFTSLCSAPVVQDGSLRLVDSGFRSRGLGHPFFW